TGKRQYGGDPNRRKLPSCFSSPNRHHNNTDDLREFHHTECRDPGSNSGVSWNSQSCCREPCSRWWRFQFNRFLSRSSRIAFSQHRTLTDSGSREWNRSVGLRDSDARPRDGYTNGVSDLRLGSERERSIEGRNSSNRLHDESIFG